MVNTTCKGNTINNVSSNVKDACLRTLLSFYLMRIFWECIFSNLERRKLTTRMNNQVTLKSLFPRTRKSESLATRVIAPPFYYSEFYHSNHTLIFALATNDSIFRLGVWGYF